MGGSKKKKNQNRNANKPASDTDVETIDVDDIATLETGELDELPAEAMGRQPHVDVSAAELADATDKPAKTWLDHQVERMRRANQHNMLSAAVVRSNHAAAKLTEKQAESIAKDIEMHTQAARAALEEFLGRIPEDFKGVTPMRNGGLTTTRQGFLKGVKVRIKEDAQKSYAQLFSPEELNDLTVDATAGTNVVLITASKAKLVVPSKKVEAVVAKQAA
jgi:hypothetical protein